MHSYANAQILTTNLIDIQRYLDNAEIYQHFSGEQDSSNSLKRQKEFRC